MTAEQFAYWLQGFSELNGGPPTAAQWASVKEHLATVFGKVTPPVDTAADMDVRERVLRRIKPDTIARTRLRDTLIC